MILFVTVLHILLSVIMILVILLQPGKGGDVAAAFGAGGGGGGAVFGPRGPGSLLSKATTGVAVLFMVTSITLALNSQDRTRGGDDELGDEIFIGDEEGFLPAFQEKTPIEQLPPPAMIPGFDPLAPATSGSGETEDAETEPGDEVRSR